MTPGPDRPRSLPGLALAALWPGNRAMIVEACQLEAARALGYAMGFTPEEVAELEAEVFAYAASVPHAVDRPALLRRRLVLTANYCTAGPTRCAACTGSPAPHLGDWAGRRAPRSR